LGAYEVLSPVFRVLPEVPKPPRRLSLRERLFWTGIVLLTYLAMCQIPLYGIKLGGEPFAQPFFFWQVVMASRSGTLMELGIGPIVMGGLVWEVLVGSGIVRLDLSTREGRVLFAGVQKIMTFLFGAYEALAYIIGGRYGRLDPFTSFLVFAQLMAATLVVLLMDEMLQKGWGLGSAVSLFIAAGVAQQIFWELFSPIGPMADGLYVGVIPSAVYATYVYISTGNATLLRTLVARPTGFPDLTGLVAMILFVLLLVFLESMRIEIPIALVRYGGLRGRLPLKFLYVSNIPVIFASALYTVIFVFTQALWPKINPGNTNPWLNMIAMYNVTRGRYVPLKGSLVYYMSPPRTLAAVAEDPIHAVVYALLLIILSVLFALAWVQISGMDPRSQAEQLVKARLSVPGFRSSPKVLAAQLERYIWPLTVLSGIIVGAIAAVSDMIGVLGTGIGILLMVGILVQYYQLLARERALEMYPMLAKLLGE